MNYAQIRSMDISNGKGIGVSIFVQGCSFHCKNCFNPETWDFNSGKPFTNEIKEKFISLLKPNYITRCTILGGEPLATLNLQGVCDLITTIKAIYPTIDIWLYTGYTVNEIISNKDKDNLLRQHIISMCNYVVDGRYEEDKRDLTLAFRGSSNQRVLNKKQINKLLEK